MTFHITIWIDLQFNKIAKKLNRLLEKVPFFAKFCCVFFEYTSFYTNFILFNNWAFLGFNISIGLFVHMYYDVICNLFLQIQLYGFSNLLSILLSTPFGFKAFFFIIQFFYSVIFYNSILCHTDIVGNYMKKKYGTFILKELHHNMGAGQFVRGWGGVFTAAFAFCSKDLFEYLKVRAVQGAYVEVATIAIQNGQTPPQNPVTIVVHTVQNSESSVNASTSVNA